jgi:SOS response regulatory protein OraA/RecX
MAGRRPEPTPAQRALALLVRREHSRPELARKLRARGMVRRRFGATLETLPVRRKAADFLLRRGFDGDVVRAVTRAGPVDLD